MPSTDVFGAHWVLRQVNPGRTLRVADIIKDAHVDELTVRRELDQLALDGQVKRLYVGEHAMAKKTDRFDPDCAPNVDVAEKKPTVKGVLSLDNYEPPTPRVLKPSEDYEKPGCPKGYMERHEPTGKILPKRVLEKLGHDPS